MIPHFEAEALERGEADTLSALWQAARDTGFLTVSGTALTPERVSEVIALYRAFFRLPDAAKAKVDMARTGANRGWGASGSEQVDPEANPDYKQYFDCGFSLPPGDPLAHLPVYAPNLWPEDPSGFRAAIKAYYADALDVAMLILRALARAIGTEPHYFDDKFDKPMALLRGNYYPARPSWAGTRDFGIATHTDYGCITLLALDGTPGLEVRKRGGGWIPVTADPGTFVINFGEMLEGWTERRVRATPHRVVGSDAERISVPLFFNPNHDANVAPIGSGETILAGDHLSRRFNETYVHLQKRA